MNMNIKMRMYPHWKDSREEATDESFYSRRIRALLVEEDALRSEEEGFMQGYEEDFEKEDDFSWLNERSSEEVI